MQNLITKLTKHEEFVIVIIIALFLAPSYDIYFWVTTANDTVTFPNNVKHFFADTGDGWDSSFAIAATLAQPHLRINNTILPRAQTIIVGGDIVYPYPTSKELKERFVVPFMTALHRSEDNMSLLAKSPKHDMVNWIHPSQLWTKFHELLLNVIGNHPGFRYLSTCSTETSTESYDHGYPEMWVIPGNHDALDGLNSFGKYILDEDRLGGWELPQTTEYYAIEKCGWVILGVHDQHAAGHDADIDRQQLCYFKKFLKDHKNAMMGYFGSNPENVNVLLALHSPFWILNKEPGKRLQKLFSEIRDSGFRLKIIIAGDMHYYAHHVPEIPDAPHLIVSGGGGAFLHSTYWIPKNITTQIGDQDIKYSLITAYPNKLTAAVKLLGLIQNYYVWIYTGLIAFFYGFILEYWETMLPLLWKSFSSVGAILACLLFAFNWKVAIFVAAIVSCWHCAWRSIKRTRLRWTKLNYLLLVLYPAIASGIVVLFSLHLHLCGIDDALFAALMDPNFKNFVRFQLDGTGKAFVVGLQEAFPRHMQFTTSMDSAQLLYISFTREWEKWFLNNLVPVDFFNL